MKKSILHLSAILFLVSSCVTPKIHNALLSEHKTVNNKLTANEKKVLQLNDALEEKEEKILILENQHAELRNDSIQNGKALTVLQDKYNELSDTYDLLTSKNSRYMADKAKETKKLLEQLEQAQTALFEKEDELNNLSRNELKLLAATAGADTLEIITQSKWGFYDNWRYTRSDLIKGTGTASGVCYTWYCQIFRAHPQ